MGMKKSGVSDEEPIHTMWQYLEPHFMTGSQQNDLLEILHAHVATNPEQTVLTIGHLGKKNKHWVALAVDTEAKKIHYGDSVGSPIPTNLLAVYQWWMQQHCSSSFKLNNLPITQQEDESSCGILYAPLKMQAARMSTFIWVANTILELVRLLG